MVRTVFTEERTPPTEESFTDEAWLKKVSIDLRQLDAVLQHLISPHKVTGQNRIVWAIKALTLTDLTTLAGDDTAANVSRLCQRAAFPFPVDCLADLDPKTQEKIHTAAVCVYPSRVGDAYRALSAIGKEKVVPIAAVATGFPTGQYSLESRLKEIEFAISQGASEIDIVIDRSLALQGRWSDVYNEIVQMRRVCGTRAHLKAILAIGELGTMENVSTWSRCIFCGTFFI